MILGTCMIMCVLKCLFEGKAHNLIKNILYFKESYYVIFAYNRNDLLFLKTNSHPQVNNK